MSLRIAPCAVADQCTVDGVDGRLAWADLDPHRTGCYLEDMNPPSYKLRSADSPAIYDPPRRDGAFPAVRSPRIDESEEDPYRYGFRERLEKAPDGSEKLCWIPLTYEDTLDPQLGDRVSNDSIHNELTVSVSSWDSPGMPNAELRSSV